jgi:hypothetical protein
MLSIKRITDDFKSTNMLLARRNGWVLLILSLWMILQHYVYFKTAHWDSSAQSGYPLIYILMGIMTATDVFAKLRGSVSGSHYLLTPSSTEEKFISAWLYSTLYAFTVTFVLTTLIHTISMVLGNVLTGENLPMDYPSLRDLGQLFFKMMFIQSLFFLGSVFFRKNPAVKTIATLFGLSFIVGITASLIFKGYIEMQGAYTFNINSEGDWQNMFTGMDTEHLANTLKIIAKTGFYAIPFVCWTASYFTLKNKQL